MSLTRTIVDGAAGVRLPGAGCITLAIVLVKKKRKRIEECFGWLKTIALLRKVRHRGVCKVD